MVKDENGLYHPPTKKLKFKKILSWKNFAINCHGSHMGLTNRNHNKSSSTPSLNLAVVGCPSAQIVLKGLTVHQLNPRTRSPLFYKLITHSNPCSSSKWSIHGIVTLRPRSRWWILYWPCICGKNCTNLLGSKLCDFPATSATRASSEFRLFPHVLDCDRMIGEQPHIPYSSWA